MSIFYSKVMQHYIWCGEKNFRQNYEQDMAEILQVQKNWFRIFGAFQHWMNQFYETGIFRFFQTSQKSIFHNSHKFTIAQLIVH